MRLVIAPFIFFAIKANNIISIVVLGAIVILTDILDGFLARKLNSISEAGKVLDPLADKLCVASVALAACLYGDLPFLLLAVIIARDLIIATAGLIVIKKKKRIPVSNIWGKITVFVLSMVLIIYILKIYLLYPIAYWSVITFVIISLISYFFTGLKFIGYKA